ncbi:hypothetical protein LDE05_18060 [Lactobacillus delbrueckii subsp. bulgaricus]|nr:hypothetical protein LDE05_18060 [Lactobacillus delbrueckii subsp. bulgaricus]
MLWEVNTQPNLARLIMAQKPAYNFKHKLAIVVTVEWQLNPFGPHKSVSCRPVLKLESTFQKLKRDD